MTATFTTIDAVEWSAIIGCILSLVAGARSFFYQRRKAAKAEQKYADDITELKKWKVKHEIEYAQGIHDLIALKSGMSDGAETSFGRLENQLSQVLTNVRDNAKQVSELAGQVKELARMVGLLVTRETGRDHA